MEQFDDSRERSGEPILDRREIAVSLRKLGIDVDFEDWDELDDDDVLGNIATLAAMHDFGIEEVLKAVTPTEKVGDIDDEI